MVIGNINQLSMHVESIYHFGLVQIGDAYVTWWVL